MAQALDRLYVERVQPVVEQLIPDVLAPGLDVVFCGTALSVASHSKRAYYAKPGNRFWPTLAAVGFTPRRLAPVEYAEVTRYGLGLTDVSKTAFGQDADLLPHDFDPVGLIDKILDHRPQFLAFTSKRAAREALDIDGDYGLQATTIGETGVFVLPSTSGLATRFWDETHWHELARLVGR